MQILNNLSVLTLTVHNKSYTTVYSNTIIGYLIKMSEQQSPNPSKCRKWGFMSLLNLLYVCMTDFDTITSFGRKFSPLEHHGVQHASGKQEDFPI